MSDLSRKLFFQLVDVTGEINGQKCCVLTNTIQMDSFADLSIVDESTLEILYPYFSCFLN